MQIVSVTPHNVNGGKCAKMHPLFYMFLGASAKFKSDTAKGNGDTGCTKMEKNFFLEGFQQSVFNCVTVQCSSCHHLLSGILAVTY